MPYRTAIVTRPFKVRTGEPIKSTLAQPAICPGDAAGKVGARSGSLNPTPAP